MTVQGWLQILVFFGVVVAITKPIGVYLHWVFERERTPGRLERGVLRLCGVREPREQTWLEYTVAMLVFSALGLVVTYLIQRTQGSDVTAGTGENSQRLTSGENSTRNVAAHKTGGARDERLHRIRKTSSLAGWAVGLLTGVWPLLPPLEWPFECPLPFAWPFVLETPFTPPMRPESCQESMRQVSPSFLLPPRIAEGS